MKPWIDTVKGLAEGMMKPIEGIIDSTITNQEERGKVKNEIMQTIQGGLMANEKELSSRHLADMQSDSWLSKNIRPMTLIFILVLYTIFSLTDGNIGSFNVTDAYVKLLGNWGMMIMSFYFGGRSMEKILGKINLKRKND